MAIQHTRRRTLLAAAVTAGLLVPLVSTVAQADPACRTVALPTPAGTTSTVTGGDLTGSYLVGLVTYPDRTAGALWRDGRFTEIDASSIQHAQVDYHDVNRHGVVVGERMTDFQTFHTDAFIYRGGKFTFLPALRAGDSTEALGINSRGDVVGNSVGNGNGWRPVVWPADEPGTVRLLSFPAGHPGDGRAVGIDEDGSVVGYLSPYPPGTPFLWPAKGSPRPLATPADSIGGIAVAIQGGVIAGNVYDPATSSTVPTLWNVRTGGFKMFTDVHAGALSVNRWGTLGVGGAIVHADGRVASVGSGALVNAVADNGVAAGSTALFNGQAVSWLGC
jgi:hypothetical protein